MSFEIVQLKVEMKNNTRTFSVTNVEIEASKSWHTYLPHPHFWIDSLPSRGPEQVGVDTLPPPPLWVEI